MKFSAKIGSSPILKKKIHPFVFLQIATKLIRLEKDDGTRSRVNGKNKILWHLVLEISVTMFKRNIIVVSDHEEHIRLVKLI